MSRLNRILFKKVALISALKVIRLLTICNEELQIVICPAKKRNEAVQKGGLFFYAAISE